MFIIMKIFQGGKWFTTRRPDPLDVPQDILDEVQRERYSLDYIKHDDVPAIECRGCYWDLKNGQCACPEGRLTEICNVLGVVYVEVMDKQDAQAIGDYVIDDWLEYQNLDFSKFGMVQTDYLPYQN